MVGWCGSGKTSGGGRGYHAAEGDLNGVSITQTTGLGCDDRSADWHRSHGGSVFRFFEFCDAGPGGPYAAPGDRGHAVHERKSDYTAFYDAAVWEYLAVRCSGGLRTCIVVAEGERIASSRKRALPCRCV